MKNVKIILSSLILAIICCSSPVSTTTEKCICVEEKYFQDYSKEIIVLEDCDTQLQHVYSVDQYIFHPAYNKDEYDFLILYYESNAGNAYYCIGGDGSYVKTKLKCDGLDDTYPLSIISKLISKVSKCEYEIL